MRLSLGFEQKQVQKQILAPRMIQSMEILQLPILALEARIDQELNENPLLERQEKDPDLPEEVASPEDEAPAPDADKEFVVEDNTNNSEDFERLSDLSQEVPDYFDEQPRMSSNRLSELSSRQHDAIANIASRSVTLQDSLETQLRDLDVPDDVMDIAIRIISTLDSNGYLLVALEDLLPPDAPTRHLELAEDALRMIQSLEPAGVGARSLKECLLLQLEPRMPLYEEMRIMISDHLDDLKENRLPQIRKKTGFSFEQIQEIWGALRTLNPKPGAVFEDVAVQTVTPDVFVDRDEAGKFVVRLEERGMPHLRISNYYRRRLASGEATPDEREYIKRKINAAQWLMESIEQRRSTLTRVSQAIIDHQIRFLEEGPEAIEPLKMQQIADKVKVHVTTVSRAVDDKWIQTPRGVFALRNFFVGGTTDAEGEEVAWDAIRRKLQEIVDHEDKTNPFSDDDLVDQLQKQGFTVARRTVTKYRKKMDIPSSRQRRDWSQIESTPAAE